MGVPFVKGLKILFGFPIFDSARAISVDDNEKNHVEHGLNEFNGVVVHGTSVVW